MIIKNNNTIHLQGRDVSYIMFVNEMGDLLHFYFGKKIADCDYYQMKDEWNEIWGFVSNQIALDVYPQEYPAYGYSDLRNPAYQVVNKHGNAVSRLIVKEIEILKGVAHVEGMPELIDNENTSAETLKVTLVDEIIDLKTELYYTVFDEYNVIARSAVIINGADKEVEILSAYSTSIDFPMDDYDIVHFAGAWGRERDMHRTLLTMGMKAEIENARGGSGSQLNPFVMVASKDADEFRGDVYGFSLIYSGNHSTVAKVDQFGFLRVQQGINPHQFNWKLAPG
ncbi:MAG: alpha-galactosidase, partial [Lachnospiraceae bacterium]|nr:alpha-galactosidase [Lachnospiraceae bacterium]